MYIYFIDNKKEIDFRGDSLDVLRTFPVSARLEKRIMQLKLTQEQAAELLGVTQPRVSDLMRGKINLFALDVLVNMTTAAGLHVEMRITKMKKAA